MVDLFKRKYNDSMAMGLLVIFITILANFFLVKWALIDRQNSFQEERFSSESESGKYKGLMSLNQEIYTKNCEPNTIIMHPLPRDSRPDANELDPDLNQNPNLAIYRQTDNGLLIRMALFSLVLGVQNKIEESTSNVAWFSNK